MDLLEENYIPKIRQHDFLVIHASVLSSKWQRYNADSIIKNLHKFRHCYFGICGNLEKGGISWEENNLRKYFEAKNVKHFRNPFKHLTSLHICEFKLFIN